MIHTLLVLLVCFLLMATAVCLGSILLSAGIYSKYYGFFEAMRKVRDWQKHFLPLQKKQLLLENKSKT